MLELRSLRLVTLLLSLAVTSCSAGDLDSEDVEASQGTDATMPTDLRSYQITFYNTKIVSNPSNLAVASSVVYRFVSATTVLGKGQVTLPTDNWSYTNSNPGGSYTTATILLDYGRIGTERYSLTYNGSGSSVQSRQTFSFQGNLQGNSTVRTTGYFVITKI